MTEKPWSERFSQALAGDRSDDHDERDREFRRESPAEQDAGDNEERKAEHPRIERRQALQNLPKLDKRSPRRDGHPDHVAEHRRPDLDADAGQEPDQRRTRQKVGEKAELENAGENEKAGGQQRDHADEGHVMRAGRLGHAR